MEQTVEENRHYGIIDLVVADTVSPVFVGRQAELTMLADAYATARDGDPAVVLLGAEAGGGKTRLVNEFVGRLADGPARVLLGGCLELSSEGLPYAPVTAALRQLVREIGVDGVTGLLPGGDVRDLARLLPGLGEAARVSTDDKDNARARLFEQMLTLLERLAAETPLVLIVEDAHWADRSTRDLLTFLAHSLHGRVLLIVTFRSDELHRTHPLRPMLTDLGRLDRTVRVDLPRLERTEVAAQLTGILRRPPEPDLVSAVYGRSAGIPLFVEATAELGPEAGQRVPESLRDLLLAPVRRLPDETQEVLGAASAQISMTHRLLTKVTGLDEQRLTAALRPAVDAGVLVLDGDRYVFRHALIGEAIHDDLLPGEHTRHHRRFAEVLEDSPELGPDCNAAVALALHWSSAHDHEKALLAAWRAADQAAASLAHAEQVQMLERVLALWDQVPKAAELIGDDHVAVLEKAADAAHSGGEADRGLAFVRAALAELDSGQDADRVALLLVWRAKLKAYKGVEGELDDLRLAARLAAGNTAVRAKVLARLTSGLLLHGMDEECQAIGEQTHALARELGDEEAAVDASVTLATVGSWDGTTDVDHWVGELRAALATAERLGGPRLLLRTHVNLSHMLEGAGRHQEAVEVALAGWAIAKQVGRARTHGPFLVGNAAGPLIALGRFAEADALIDECLAFNPAPSLHGYLLIHRGNLAVARGDMAAIQQALESMPASFREPHAIPQEALPYARLLLDSRIARRDLAGALEVADLVRAQDGRRHRYLWPLLLSAMRACSEVTATASGLRDEALPARAAMVREMLREKAAEVPANGPWMNAHAVAFAAEAERAEGRLDLAAWDAAAAAWDALRVPYQTAEALTLAAEAAAADGDRDGAVSRLCRAAELAERLNARPLTEQITALARRARIPLPGTTPRPAGHGLTPRELEVLRLVAAGRTNREIAETLFISAKTASVHVSNILSKLGTATRGEAAATAHRLGLTDDTTHP